MKTFDEITGKFFMPDDIVPSSKGDTSDDSEFVIPECWKPKTIFQANFLKFACMNTNGDYSGELLAALRQCFEDFADRHTITRTEILFDGNLNFTVTAGGAESNTFSLANNPGLMAGIAVDGEQLPSIQTESYTGMTAKLKKQEPLSGGFVYFVTLSHVDADAFTNGEHHVLISVTTIGRDLEPKTYKELVFTGVPNGTIHPIVANEMLPKTPEELAFALLKGIPVDFSDDDSGPAIDHQP